MLEGEIRLIQPDYFNGYQFCYIDGMAILSFRKFEKYLIDLQQDLAREEKKNGKITQLKINLNK